MRSSPSPLNAVAPGSHGACSNASTSDAGHALYVENWGTGTKLEVSGIPGRQAGQRRGRNDHDVAVEAGWQKQPGLTKLRQHSSKLLRLPVYSFNGCTFVYHINEAAYVLSAHCVQHGDEMHKWGGTPLAAA